MGGRRTPRSGAGRIKGDVQNREVMVEAKTTANTQYTLKLADLEKLETEAIMAGKRPLFVIRLADDAPARLSDREWALLPMSDYLALAEGDQDD